MSLYGCMEFVVTKTIVWNFWPAFATRAFSFRSAVQNASIPQKRRAGGRKVGSTHIGFGSWLIVPAQHCLGHRQEEECCQDCRKRSGW